MQLIKRYPNRKLYDTVAKQYITLDGIAELIRQGMDVRVIDHASGEDLTALTLTQIILEQEKKQSGLLSNSTLTNLIRVGSEGLAALQLGFHTSIGFLRHFDDEIRQRVQALVKKGELSEADGVSILDKLLQQGKSSVQERRQSNTWFGKQQLEEYLQNHFIPTQEDIKKLTSQLDELAKKIDSLQTTLET